ncbi:MAG: hypothetical protein ACR2NR_23220 [Solirubrobacteraceae bacterium]
MGAAVWAQAIASRLAAEESRASFFEQHHTRAAQALPPAPGLREHAPLRRAVTDAGFVAVEIIELAVNRDPEQPRPYALIADRD